MSDTQELIQKILLDSKIAGSSHFTGQIYRDEPILQTAAQMAAYPPSKYLEMRKIPPKPDLYYEFDAKIFYQQGKFMEDFTDDFDYQGEFIRYYPTYQSMNDRQLRGYFSWRTKVRQGITEKTSLSFAFVYIYELLNQIGVSSAEEGFYTLKKFWLAYREIDPQIDRYAKLWMKDYVIYNNLESSLLEGIYDFSFDQAALVLVNYRSYSLEEVFSALISLSTYRLEKSRFYKQYPAEVKQVVYAVFARLSDYYAKNRKNSICEKFFGKMYATPYSLFRSAVFYHKEHPKNFVYQINEVYQYRCKAGAWSCMRFFSYKGKIQQLGGLLKSIDFWMRERFGFKSTLKMVPSTKVFQETILQEIDQYQANQRKKALPEVKIDLSQLQEIRAGALKTQNKLIISEEEDDIQVLSPQSSAFKQDTWLSESEYEFMSCLLYGRTYEALLQAQGLMQSVLVDSINEKLFERFGDTVILEDGDGAELIPDYIEELKGIVLE